MSQVIENSSRWDSTETLLAGKRYGSLYRLKEALFRRFRPLAAMYSFNKYERLKWVEAKSRQIKAGSKLIDVGAGSCPYRELFSHCTYVAHDIGKLEDNQLQGRKGYGNLHLVSDINSIPADSASFDVVLCTEVIEHVPEPIQAVKEMARLLRSGGTLLLTAPLRSALHQMPYHYYAGYTPSWYEKFLTEAGFTEIEVVPVCGVFNAYSEASLLVMLYLSPFSSTSLATRLMLFPIWLLTLPWLAVLCPALCAALDGIGLGREFTLGYRVEARKA